MVQWFVRPENALKRAEELLEVGRKEDALETLHDVIKSRRHRTWTMTHEAIIKKHLELCVSLKKPLQAKDALWQYRNIVQQINVKSLEDVVTFYLKLAEKKAEEARKEAQGTVPDDIEDLDLAESPETLLLAAVTGAGAQDRADRSILSPWLRFLWESYRQCLELLRNNIQVETLYHKVARQAFNFCKNYQRRAEFRKLCDNLRQHLTQLQRSQQYTYSVKLSNADTIAMLQETRLFQMDVAIQMELWQEAYKSSEDVHQINQWGGDKRALKPQAVANYYEKLALIFWKAGNRLFHAAALLRLFQHMKDMKKTFGGEEATQLATRLVLSILTIPESAGSPSQLGRHLDVEELTVGNQIKLSKLLELKSPPTRASLIKELPGRFNILPTAHPSAISLYRAMEESFKPLRMATQILEDSENIKNTGKEAYIQYLEPMKAVASLRILQQISQVYQTIKLDKILKMVPFVTKVELERLVVQSSKKYLLEARVDHRANCLEFNSRVGLLDSQGDDDKSPKNTFTVSGGVKIGKEDRSNQLQKLYSALNDATQLLDGERRMEKKYAQLNHCKQICTYHSKTDYQHILERKRRIELYKEASEQQRLQHLERERKIQEREAEDRRVKELQKLEADQKEYAEQQRREKTQELKKKMVQDKIETLQKSKIGQMVIASIDTNAIEDMEPEELIKAQVDQMNKERQDHHNKLQTQEKKWDHLIRALHIEEVPFREAQFDEKEPKLIEAHKKYESDRIQKAKDERNHRINTFERLSRLQENANQFLDNVRKGREDALKNRTQDWQKKVEDQRRKRLQEKRDQRKNERRKQWLKEQEELKRKKEMEEMAKQDMDRRPKFGKRDDDRMPMRREEGDSGADTDDWRSARQGPLQTGPPPSRGGPGGRGGMEREPRMDVEEKSNWRDGPPSREPPIRNFDRGPPPMGRNYSGRDDFPAPERRMPPQEEENDWRARAAPAGPLPGEEPAPGGRFVPPMERRRMAAEPGYPPLEERRRPMPERDEPRWGERAGPITDDARGPLPMERGPPRDEMRGPPRPVEEDNWRRGGPPAPMPTRELPPRDMPPRDMPPRDMPPRDMPPRDMPPRDMPPRDGYEPRDESWRRGDPRDARAYPPERRAPPPDDRFSSRRGPMEPPTDSYRPPGARMDYPPVEEDMGRPGSHEPEGDWHVVAPRRGQPEPDDWRSARRGPPPPRDEGPRGYGRPREMERGMGGPPAEGRWARPGPPEEAGGRWARGAPVPSGGDRFERAPPGRFDRGPEPPRGGGRFDRPEPEQGGGGRWDRGYEPEPRRGFSDRRDEPPPRRGF